MILTTYQEAGKFLATAQAALEAHEAANSLMLGRCLSLAAFPERVKRPPYLATVTDETGLILAALMTPPQKLLLAGGQPDPGRGVTLVAQDLLAQGWPVAGVTGQTDLAGEFAATWTALAGGHYEPGMQLCLYELVEVSPPLAVPGHLRVAASADLELVVNWLAAFDQETEPGGGAPHEVQEIATQKINAGDIYLWEDGQPVSIAGKSRPTAHTISINLVYTPPAFRKRGYASALVAATSQLMLDTGYGSCVLFTDLANPTSNHIYQSIGYRPVCDFNDYFFA